MLLAHVECVNIISDVAIFLSLHLISMNYVSERFTTSNLAIAMHVPSLHTLYA